MNSFPIERKEDILLLIHGGLFAGCWNPVNQNRIQQKVIILNLVCVDKIVDEFKDHGVINPATRKKTRKRL